VTEVTVEQPAREKPPVTVKRRVAEVIEIHAEREYAVFSIDQQPERSYYALAIESSFGGFSYAWSSPGRSFYDFLAGISVDYVLGKMVGRDEVFDGEATSRAIRKDILRMRRKGECSAEEARDEWPPNEFDGDCAFWDWCRDTELFKDRDAHLYYETCSGPRARDFIRLYEVFWPILAGELKKT
jgi:hypothetical protein